MLLYRPGWNKLFIGAPLGRNRDPAISTRLSLGHTHPKIQPTILPNGPNLTDRDKERSVWKSSSKKNKN